MVIGGSRRALTSGAAAGAVEMTWRRRQRRSAQGGRGGGNGDRVMISQKGKSSILFTIGTEFNFLLADALGTEQHWSIMSLLGARGGLF